MVCLIRHAHAGDKHQWPGRDHDRPLSVPGQHEAHGLLVRLRGYPISRILASPAVRCAQTVEPLSQRRAVPIELVDALRVDALDLPPGGGHRGYAAVVDGSRLMVACCCSHSMGDR